MEQIEHTTTIEDLVENVPRVVGYLIDQGLPCIVCGQPVWGTLAEMAREKGRTDQEIDKLIADMNSKLVLKKSP